MQNKWTETTTYLSNDELIIGQNKKKMEFLPYLNPKLWV